MRTLNLERAIGALGKNIRGLAAQGEQAADECKLDPAVAPVRGARKAVVHVNQHRIKDNARTGRIAPAIAVKEGTCNRYCHELYVAGPSWFIYRPHKPLPCGARVWLETYAQCSLIVRCGEED